MDRKLLGLLIANGALVLFAGFAVGFPYGTALMASLAPDAPAGIAEAVRAWHMAHLEGVLNGLLMLAGAGVSALMTMTRNTQRVIFWGLIVCGWTNIVASTISALTGGRGTGLTGFDWNSVDFLLFMAGIIGGVAATIALALAGLRTSRDA